MGSKNKKGIPQGRADIVQFEADRTCCICRDQSKHIQIHHIDGNSENNEIDNLVVLCLEHHHEATTGSGIGRGLSQGLLRKYRKSWLDTVRARRENALADFTIDEGIHKTLLDALACHEIRRVHSQLNENGWDTKISLLKELVPYTNFSYGYSVRAQILYALNVLSDRTRLGMPEQVASMIENIAFSAMPIVSLVSPYQKPISDNDKSLLISGMELGFSISYDGIKYLRELKIVNEGARILFVILRFVHINDIKDLKAEIIEKFTRLINLSTEKNFEDSVRLLQFERDDALALDGDKLPQFPKDIMIKLIDKTN